MAQCKTIILGKNRISIFFWFWAKCDPDISSQIHPSSFRMPVCVVLGRLCSSENVLPKSPSTFTRFQTAQRESGQAGQTWEKTTRDLKQGCDSQISEEQWPREMGGRGAMQTTAFETQEMINGCCRPSVLYKRGSWIQIASPSRNGPVTSDLSASYRTIFQESSAVSMFVVPKAIYRSDGENLSETWLQIEGSTSNARQTFKQKIRLLRGIFLGSDGRAVAVPLERWTSIRLTDC